MPIPENRLNIIVVTESDYAGAKDLPAMLAPHNLDVRMLTTPLHIEQEIPDTHPHLMLMTEGVAVNLLAKKELNDIPKIVVSSRYTDEKAIQFLDGGAAQYAALPTDASELALFSKQIRAVHRRRMRQFENDSTFQVGDFVVNLYDRSITRDGQRVHMTPFENLMLVELVRNQGKGLTKEMIQQKLQTNTLAIDTRISSLRARLQPGVPASESLVGRKKSTLYLKVPIEPVKK